MVEVEKVFKWVLVMLLLAYIGIALMGCASRKVCTMEEWLVTSDCP